MYGERQSGNSSVSISVIDAAFDDINKISIELSQELSNFGQNSNYVEARSILTKVSVLLGYMISVRNQLVIFKRQSSITGNAVAKDYLNELKVQMDGLKSIAYSYGAILSSMQEQNRLDSKLQ